MIGELLNALNCSKVDMQIWKSADIFVFSWKKCADGLTLLRIFLFEICTRETWEMFAYQFQK